MVGVRVSSGARLQGHSNLSASRNLAPCGVGNGGSRWQDEGFSVTLSHPTLLLRKPRPSSLTCHVLLCELLPKQAPRKRIETCNPLTCRGANSGLREGEQPAQGHSARL